MVDVLLSSCSILQKSYRNELIFYRKFHQHYINLWIHAIAIPIEWISFLLFLSIFKLQWFVVTITGIYYILATGSKICYYAAFAQFCYGIIATKMFSHLNNVIFSTILVSILMQVVSWTLQVIIGHRMIENNNPGMTTSLTFNSIILSPILAWDYITQC